MTHRRHSHQALALALGILAAGAAVASPSEEPAKDKAGAAPATAEPSEPRHVFESFQLVLLRRGPRWSKEVTPDVERIQKEHLAHLTRMGDEGHMVVAGPFGDQKDETLRGACIYRVGSVEEARRLAEQDPAVLAGRLAVEVVTWYVEKDYMVFPKAPKPSTER